MKDLIAGLALVGGAVALGRSRGVLNGLGGLDMKRVESLLQIARDALKISRGATNCWHRASGAVHAFSFASIAEEYLKQDRSYEDDEFDLRMEMHASIDDIRGSSMGQIASCLR